jgi:hypothetical protein
MFGARNKKMWVSAFLLCNTNELYCLVLELLIYMIGFDSIYI